MTSSDTPAVTVLTIDETAPAVSTLETSIPKTETPTINPPNAVVPSVAPPANSSVPSPMNLPVAVAAPAASATTATITATTIAAPRRPSMITSTTTQSPTPKNATKSKKKKSPPIAMVASPTMAGGANALGENTGRWTAEEHRLFLQGLEQHGKGWKKIASLIKSRTVVQIRTHAQKYFQKLAKARQNGEDGDVTMEGRGGAASVTSVSSSVVAQTNKRRRQITGTKRKAIQSVVASAQKQGKKLATAQAAAGVPNPVPPLPAVSPALAHFLLPRSGCAASSSTTQGNISGPALEDSLFRFLTPVPVATPPQVNEVARQAGANPITLPSSNPSTAPSVAGEVSPTGVQDPSFYSSWTDAKDPPSWYAKGADVDALLDVADTLDWLADTGDLNESYPTTIENDPPQSKSHELSRVTNSTSVTTLPDVDSNVDTVVPPLPSLFDGTSSCSNEGMGVDDDKEVSMGHLHTSPSETDMSHLQVFDTPMEEHDFVSTILETTTESSCDHLAGLS